MSEAVTRPHLPHARRRTSSASALASEWGLPAFADSDTDIPFTDLPKPYAPGLNASGTTRTLDLRKIDGLITPADQFFFIQHKNQPKIDPATYKLKFTGLVKAAAEFLWPI